LFRHLVKHFQYKRYLIVRNPYNRISSLFSDKYRKLPKLILDGRFEWESAHKVLYPFLNVDNHRSDTEIAETFMKLELSDFINLLPSIIFKDHHFIPQNMARGLRIYGNNYLYLPVHNVFSLENDIASIQQRMHLDFSIKKNTSNSGKYMDLLSRKEIMIVNKLYKCDFPLGKYNVL